MSNRPPGWFGKSEQAEVVLMIGTAGHVDHGKTRLVKLLTGCETDRLQAEKDRGLTIELGFAPCFLKSGLAAGIVDVPGHEHFIRNMVAGAAGMDMAILVVAADDGVMPQTIEHLQIMQFLGVQRGLVALTKIDLVEQQRVEEVCVQIESLCEGTFLEGAPISPVSSETLEGFDKFFNTLVEVATASDIIRREGIFRMPVDRVFSAHGRGLVVTGMPLAGTVATGDHLEIQPGGQEVRVRAMERFLRPAKGGSAGQCLALNLAGLSGSDRVERGSLLAAPGYVCPSGYIQVELLTCFDLSRPLKDGERVRLHTGTVEAYGRLFLYDRKTADRGEKVLAAVQVDAPIAACATDPFVLRRNSPVTTCGGGTILNALPRKPRGSRAAMHRLLAIRRKHFNTPIARLEHFFMTCGNRGGTREAAAKDILLNLDKANEWIDRLIEQGRLIECLQDSLVHSTVLAEMKDETVRLLEEHHRERPQDFGPLAKDLIEKLKTSEEVFTIAKGQLIEDGRLRQSGERIALAGREAVTDSPQAQLRKRMGNLYMESKFSTPRPDELPRLLDAQPAETEKALDYLCQQGTLVRLSKNVAFHSHWLDDARRKVIDIITSEKELDSGDFKNRIDSSRKYALALLDYFDSIHLTQRFGNLRVLHPSFLRKNEYLRK